jgi:hypothetical protein
MRFGKLIVIISAILSVIVSVPIYSLASDWEIYPAGLWKYTNSNPRLKVKAVNYYDKGGFCFIVEKEDGSPFKNGQTLYIRTPDGKKHRGHFSAGKSYIKGCLRYDKITKKGYVDVWLISDNGDRFGFNYHPFIAKPRNPLKVSASYSKTFENSDYVDYLITITTTQKPVVVGIKTELGNIYYFVKNGNIQTPKKPFSIEYVSSDKKNIKVKLRLYKEDNEQQKTLTVFAQDWRADGPTDMVDKTYLHIPVPAKEKPEIISINVYPKEGIPGTTFTIKLSLNTSAKYIKLKGKSEYYSDNSYSNVRFIKRNGGKDWEIKVTMNGNEQEYNKTMWVYVSNDKLNWSTGKSVSFSVVLPYIVKLSYEGSFIGDTFVFKATTSQDLPSDYQVKIRFKYASGGYSPFYLMKKNQNRTYTYSKQIVFASQDREYEVAIFRNNQKISSKISYYNAKGLIKNIQVVPSDITVGEETKFYAFVYKELPPSLELHIRLYNLDNKSVAVDQVVTDYDSSKLAYVYKKQIQVAGKNRKFDFYIKPKNENFISDIKSGTYNVEEVSPPSITKVSYEGKYIGDVYQFKVLTSKEVRDPYSIRIRFQYAGGGYSKFYPMKKVSSNEYIYEKSIIFASKNRKFEVAIFKGNQKLSSTIGSYDVSGLLKEVYAQPTVSHPGDKVTFNAKVYKKIPQTLKLYIRFYNLDNQTVAVEQEVVNYDSSENVYFFSKEIRDPGNNRKFEFYIKPQGENIISDRKVGTYTVIKSKDNDEETIKKTLSFINQSHELSKLRLGTILQHHLTRAEAAKILYEVLKLKNQDFKLPYPAELYSNPFADVDKNSDFYTALLTLAYYKGNNNNETVFTQKFGIFNPLRNITRFEFTKIVIEGFDIPISKDYSLLSKFEDKNKLSTDEIKQYFATAVKEGLIRGEPNGDKWYLQPFRELTIREGLLILGRVLNREVKVSSNQFLYPDLLPNRAGRKLGVLPEIQDYDPEATFSIKNIIKKLSTYKGYENCIVLSVEEQHNSNVKINDFYRWETNLGYFVKITANNKQVIFCPTSRKPEVDFQIVVVGTDGLGNFDIYRTKISKDSFTYTKNITDDPSALKKEVKQDIKIEPLGKELREGESFKLKILGNLLKDNLKVGIESVSIYLQLGQDREYIYDITRSENEITFIVPSFKSMYGKDVKLGVVVVTNADNLSNNNHKFVYTLKYEPKFLIVGSISPDKNGNYPPYVYINNAKVSTIDGTFTYSPPDPGIYKINAGNNYEQKSISLSYEDPRESIYVDYINNDNSKEVDSDGDGLSDNLEEKYGLNPNSIDSDNDGIPDDVEFGNGTIPKDTDGDGIIDTLDNDSDNDGITDSEEIKYGLNPYDPKDAQEDLDSDGFSNKDEILNGSNPLDPTSKPNNTPLPKSITLKLDKQDEHFTSFEILYNKKIENMEFVIEDNKGKYVIKRRIKPVSIGNSTYITLPTQIFQPDEDYIAKVRELSTNSSWSNEVYFTGIDVPGDDNNNGIEDSKENIEISIANSGHSPYVVLQDFNGATIYTGGKIKRVSTIPCDQLPHIPEDSTKCKILVLSLENSTGLGITGNIVTAVYDPLTGKELEVGDKIPLPREDFDGIENNTQSFISLIIEKYTGETTIPISKGWNLVSIPVKKTVSTNELGDFEILWKYLPNEGKWAVWSPKDTIMDIITKYVDSDKYELADKIKWGEGFWILSDKNYSLKFEGNRYGVDLLQIVSGKWNLLGTGKPVFVEEIHGTKFLWVYRNNKWYAWSPNKNVLKIIKSYANKGYIGVLSQIKKGEGFWIKAN